MKDRKSLYLLILALTLVTTSFVLISIWGYHFYFDKKKAEPVAQKVVLPTFPQKKTVKDSLQTLFNTAVEELGNPEDSISFDSSIDKTLALKLIEFNQLRNEIAEILKHKNSTGDMTEANEKISQLQESVEELKNKNDEVAAENARLSEMVKQLMDKKSASSRRTTTSTTKKHLAASAYTLPVLVSHLRFVGLSINNYKEETNIAAQTERLYGSFQVNIKPFNSDKILYVVIIQPDGKILHNSTGKAGTFITKTGTKTYSVAIHFDNKIDNGNRLVFSIDSHDFQFPEPHLAA